MLTLLSNFMRCYVSRYYTSFVEDEAIHIVMEFAEKGDLYKVRNKYNLFNIYSF